MPDFNAKMHQNRFRLELRNRPCWEELTTPPQTPYLDLRGLLLRGGGPRPVCLVLLTILATGLRWEVGRGEGGEYGGRERDGGVVWRPPL